MKLDNIIVGDRVRKDMGDLAALAASIKRHGLLHPVVVKKDRTLVAGHRRIEAARRLGWEEITVTIIDVEDLLSAERDENTERKDFTPTEAVAIGRLIEEAERPRAQERSRQAAIRNAARKRDEHGHIVPNHDKVETASHGQTRDVAAKAVGMGVTAYREAKEVVMAAELDQAAFGDLPSQMDESRNVHGAHREMRRRKGKGGKNVPLNKAGKNLERLQAQQFRAGIWQQVKDALIHLTSLPDAVEVVAIVRAHARDKTFVDKKLTTALKWLREFSDGWSKGNGKD